MAPPTKQKWANGAYTHQRYDVDLNNNDSLRRPPIRPYRHPNWTPPISSFNNPHNTTTTQQQEIIDLGQYDLIVAFGDSTMEQFVRQRPHKRGKYFYQSNISYGAKVSFGLNLQSVQNLLDLLEKGGSGQHLRNRQAYPRRAVLIGSAMWDVLDSKDTVQGTDFQDHQQACRTYIRAIRQRYPDVTILWKSPTAVHIHVVDLERLVVSKIGEAALFGIERIRYMSASRSKYLYDVQKALVLEMRQQQQDDNSGGSGDILFLDLYEATYLSADWLFPSDGRHYRPDLNRLMLQWFYPSTIGDASNNESDGVVKGDGKGGMLVDMPKPYYIDPTQVVPR